MLRWSLAVLLLLPPQGLQARDLLADGSLDWLPSGTIVEPVEGAMRINGLRTDIVRLHGAVSVQQLRDAFLAQSGSIADAMPLAQHIDGWELVARADASGGLQTLQLRNDARGHTEALFASAELTHDRARLAPPPLRLMADARITSVIESTLDRTRTTQFVAWSSQPPERARRALCSQAERDGWTVMGCSAAVVGLSRADSSVSMTVAAVAPGGSPRRAMRTVIVLNHLQAVR